MARAAITVNALGYAGGATVVWTAADKTNDHSFVNDGKTLLLVKNGSGGAMSITVKSVKDEHGRTGDVVLSLADSAEGVFGPFKPSIFNQTGGVVNVDIDADTTSFLAAVKQTF